jgi:hypothetical protein
MTEWPKEKSASGLLSTVVCTVLLMGRSDAGPATTCRLAVVLEQLHGEPVEGYGDDGDRHSQRYQ